MAQEDLTSTAANLTERIQRAATNIISMNTGLSLDDSRYVVDKATRLSMPPNRSTLPAENEVMPLEERYAWVKRALQQVALELKRRGIPDSSVDNTIHDLDTFYRGVRGIND